MRILYSFLLAMLCGLSAQAQATRVLAIVDYHKIDGHVLATDSTRYHYANSSMGSNYLNDTIRYSKADEYHINTSTFNLDKVKEHYRTYDGLNRLKIQQSYNWVNGAQNPTIPVRDEYFYSSKGQVYYWHWVIDMQGGNYINTVSDKHSNTYDNSTGLVIKKEIERWKVGPNNVDEIEIHHYIYDTNGNRLLDSVELINGHGGTAYPRNSIHYRYDANGNLELEEYYIMLNGVPTLRDELYYIYNSQGQLVKDSARRVLHTTGKPQLIDIRTYTYNNQGLLATDSFVRYDSLQATVLYEDHFNYTYTNFNYIDERIQVTIHNSTGSTAYWQKTKYIYRDEWPTDVANTIGATQNLTLYPIPTSNLLHIRWEGRLTETVQGNILNAQGQVIYQWQDEPNGNYHKQIATDNLTAGMYFLQLQSGTEKVSKQFVITR